MSETVRKAIDESLEPYQEMITIFREAPAARVSEHLDYYRNTLRFIDQNNDNVITARELFSSGEQAWKRINDSKQNNQEHSIQHEERASLSYYYEMTYLNKLYCEQLPPVRWALQADFNLNKSAAASHVNTKVAEINRDLEEIGLGFTISSTIGDELIRETIPNIMSCPSSRGRSR